MRTHIFALLSGMILLNLSGAEKIFEWGHDALNAKIAGKDHAPLSAVNVKLEEGGIRLGHHSQVRFDVSKLPPLNEYTLVLRGKIKFDIRGNYTYHDRDRLENGILSAISAGRRTLIPYGPLTTEFTSSTWTWGTFFNHWFEKDQWHWFAIGKDLKKGWTLKQMDNRIQYFRTKQSKNGIKLGKNLCFGAQNPNSKDPRLFGVEMVIGELAIYDKLLSKAELLALYGKIRGIDAELLDYALTAGKKEKLRFKFRNYSDHKWDKPVRMTFCDKDGKTITETEVNLTLKPGEDAFKTVEFTAPQTGIHKIKFDTGRSFEVLALSDQTIRAKMNPEEMQLKLLEEIDCTKPLPGRFISDGRDKIVKDKCGIYREGGIQNRSSFAYKLKKLANPNKYHVLEIEYPDNAKRSYSVQVWAEFFNRIQSGQMNALGIMTGDFHPVSNTMKKRQLLWIPYSEQIYIVLDNYRQIACERGAAVAKLRIFEVQNEMLPKLSAAARGRTIGVWDEDNGMDIDWVNMPHQYQDIDLNFWREKAEKIAEYAHYMGYNSWTYKITDYSGDRNGAWMDMNPGQSNIPFGWADVWAKIFQREGIQFRQRMNLNGFQTNGPNNLFDAPGEVSRTLEEHFVRGTECPGRVNAKGEIKWTNPLHPKTEQTLRKFIAHYRDRYSIYSQFKGLVMHECIPFTDSSILDDSLRVSYGNWDIMQFEKDTGISVPSDPDKKKCILMRYQFLNSEKIKEKWVKWRCRKFTRFLKNLTEELRKGNDRLELQVWVACSISMKNTKDRTPRFNQDLLEAGFDLEELSKIKGLRIMPVIQPDYEQKHPKNPRQEMYSMYDSNFSSAFAKQDHPSLLYSLSNNLENYLPNEFPLKKFFVPVGNWSWAKNNSYAYSWANCWPTDEFVLLPLANMLANLDMENITIGWWGFPDSGVHHLLRPFYQAFRAIPQGKYELKSNPDLPVALRACGNNFYLVNKENFPVEISLEHSGLTDLVSGKKINTKDFTLGPNEVRVFSGEFKDFKQHVRENSPITLKKQLDNLATTSKILNNPKIEKLLKETETYFREGKYTQARRMFHLHEINKVLNENKGLKLTAKLYPKETAVEVNVISFDPEKRNISVWIDRADGCWNADQQNKVNFALDPGKSKSLHIPLKDALVKDSWFGKITLAMTADNGVPVRKTFLIGGQFARKSDISEIGKDWTFSKYKMKKSTSFNKKSGLRFTWSQGYTWNEKGLYLATMVEDKDYLPADANHRHFQSDSMQYFFDGKNISNYDAASYDDSTLELIAAEIEGKFKVIHCLTPKRGVKAENSQIRVAYHHENGISYWELFIPATELPDVKFEKGSVLGVSAMINNRMKTPSGGESFMTNQEIFPYMKPGTWKDLILTDENGNF